MYNLPNVGTTTRLQHYWSILFPKYLLGDMTPTTTMTATTTITLLLRIMNPTMKPTGRIFFLYVVWCFIVLCWNRWTAWRCNSMMISPGLTSTKVATSSGMPWNQSPIPQQNHQIELATKSLRILFRMNTKREFLARVGRIFQNIFAKTKIAGRFGFWRTKSTMALQWNGLWRTTTTTGHVWNRQRRTLKNQIWI
jgi:hypothetical protein